MIINKNFAQVSRNGDPVAHNDEIRSKRGTAFSEFGNDGAAGDGLEDIQIGLDEIGEVIKHQKIPLKNIGINSMPRPTNDASVAMKRIAFPLRAPRAQTLAFWPAAVLCAAVHGYHQAFFAVLVPR